ncbi:MAG: hypothetical protein HYY52_02595 [Candidatus Melainabacteria bacterium]|nr:hypothetical protein [Candidatus Melainabacteria bacterium]
MLTQEIQPITKDAQKNVLKVICESPTLAVEELALSLKSRGKEILQEEILQVIYSISPNKNWHRATQEDILKEILEYLWTLESQILFLLPTKQKETTIVEFNQIRLQNKQSKVSKDLIRHLQSLLMVEGKNLAKFKRFEKEQAIQTDLDINIQAQWLIRMILAGPSLEGINTAQALPVLLQNSIKEKFPIISEKVGKSLQRLCERFVEKYFPKNVSEEKLKELVSLYQSIYNTHKKGTDTNLSIQSEFHDQNKLVQNVVEELKEVQDIVNKSHEGGFLSKLFMGKVKNREGVIKKVDEVISNLNQVIDLNNKTSKNQNEKVLLIQKLQSDYENIILVKNQLENDLNVLNDRLKELQSNSSNLEKDLQDKTESLERSHEKIVMLQRKTDEIPELETKANHLREELSTAKDISLRLYKRVNKLKTELLKQNNDKPKNYKINGINGQTIIKIQPNEVIT